MIEPTGIMSSAGRMFCWGDTLDVMGKGQGIVAKDISGNFVVFLDSEETIELKGSGMLHTRESLKKKK